MKHNHATRGPVYEPFESREHFQRVREQLPTLSKKQRTAWWLRRDVIEAIQQGWDKSCL